MLPPCWQHQQLRGAKAAAKGSSKKGGASSKKGGAAAGAKKKSSKVRMASKPFDERHPLNQRLVAMLLPNRPPPLEETEEQRAEAIAREKEYARMRRLEFNAWRGDLAAKLALKKAALRALPDALRVEALREDLAPFPLARNALYDAPPAAYMEEETGGKEETRGKQGKRGG